MKNLIKNFIIILFFFYTIQFTNCQVVCSEDELARELREDIEYNGKLDCLREILPSDPNETEEQKAKRIKAQWDSDCSFEAENTGDADWLTLLQQNYGLKKGLVDVNGEPVTHGQADQADMCEIIRALIASGKIQGYDDMQNLNVDLIDKIDCAGVEGQTEVCAATGSSFPDKKSWNVLLGLGSIEFSGKPVFTLGPNSS